MNSSHLTCIRGFGRRSTVVNIRSIATVLASVATLACAGVPDKSAGSDNATTRPAVSNTQASPTPTSKPGRRVVPKVYEPSTQGIIADGEISASVPRSMSESNRDDVESAMKKLVPAKRQFVRWAVVSGGFVVWVEDPKDVGNTGIDPKRYGRRILNRAGNWYYYPLTGNVEQLPGA